MSQENISLSEENFSVAVIIQARMNSSRLPAKSMKDLAGKPILAHVIERAQQIKHVSHVIVATGNLEENRPILSLAETMGAVPFSGSDENVLERFVEASKIFKTDYIIRITGDNPFTDVDLASIAVEHALTTKADLSSITQIPLGTAVELIKRKALQKAYDEADKPHQLEHVTPYIKENPDVFCIKRKAVYIYNMIKDLRLTIDTPEDYLLAQNIFNKLYKGEPFSLHHVLNYLRINPKLQYINRAVIQRPMTHSEAVGERTSTINSIQ